MTMAFIRGRDPVFVALSLGEEASRWALAFGYNGTPFFERKDMDRFGREKGEENALLLHRTDNSLHSFGEAALETFESLDDDEREEFLFFRHFTCLDGERPIKAANSSYTVPARIVLGRALEHLARSAKNNIASSGLPDRPLHWIITVPRNEAYPLLKSAMKEVYELVSSNHSFVLETEGAIIACREELMEVWRKRGEPKAFPVMLANCGKTNVDFVVLDAGATMAMKTMAPVQRMSGGAWGEQMVIAAIEQFVMRAIGAGACKMISEEDWLSFKREITEKTFSLVAHSLERLVLVPPCSMYAAIREETSTFPYGVRFSRGRLIFDSSVLQQLFEPSLAHISDQTKRLLDTIPGIHCILLVGRYAECPFLFERLHKQFNTPTLQVIRPCMASLAILKGAITLIQNQSVARK